MSTRTPIYPGGSGAGHLSRILDYVNIDAAEDTIDLTQKLMGDDADCTTVNPSPGSMWCTNARE